MQKSCTAQDPPSLLPLGQPHIPPLITLSGPSPARPLCSNPSHPPKPLSSPDELTRVRPAAQRYGGPGWQLLLAPVPGFPAAQRGTKRVLGVCKSHNPPEIGRQTHLQPWEPTCSTEAGAELSRATGDEAPTWAPVTAPTSSGFRLPQSLKGGFPPRDEPLLPTPDPDAELLRHHRSPQGKDKLLSSL